MTYAGFLQRFVALLIDAVILGILGFILQMVFSNAAASLFSTLIGWGYFAGMESSTKQATLGKDAMGIYVTGLNGERITFLRATGRYFGKILSGAILLIGYLMAIFTVRKQALHDLLASTLVVTR